MLKNIHFEDLKSILPTDLKYPFLAFYVGPINVGHLFDRPLWSIFQSVVTHNELLHTLKITVHWTCTC